MNIKIPRINIPTVNLGKWIFISLVVGFLSVVGLLAWFSRGLPDPNKVQRKSGYSTVILDREGKEELYDIYVDENRQFIPLEDIPDYLKQATVAIEDKDFYKHSGFDPLAPLRIVKNVLFRQRVIGGSTLTQQVVKNVLLTNKRTPSRKIRELMLALRIERQFSKDEILQMYLNEVPYGGTTYGVAAAAKAYFNKEPKDLNLTESVVLAGLPQSPTRYSPFGKYPQAYVGRATDVVRRMREDGYITSEQESEVLDQLDDITFKKPGIAMKAPHFVNYVKDELEEMFGPELVETGGLKVTTTLDWKLQEESENIVREEIEKVSEKLHITNGASLILDPNTGEILSMVGSRDFFNKDIDGEVNVTTRLRQPGSTIKPLVYAVAFQNGFTPASVLMDVVTEFPGKDENTPYIPKNYDGKEHGLLHLREALASSINVPSVKLVASVGVKKVLEQGYRMGMTTLEPNKENLARLGLSMALGGGEVKLIEMASAYGAFANGGFGVRPVAILKVEDRSGKVLYENKQIKPEKVIDEKVAYLINSVLSDNPARLLTFGANSYLNMGSRAVAVKTGTTNDLRDNWTIGWSRSALVAVWVGNNDNSQMKNVASGVSGAAPIWRREMLAVLATRPDKPFEIPKGVSQVEVDKVSGYPAHDGFPSYKEWIIDGTLPVGDDPIHKYAKVCRNQTDKLATPIQVANNDFDRREVIEVKEQDPISNQNLWQKAIDSWISKQTDDKYKVPNQMCGDASGMTMNITSPGNESKVDSDNVEIKFEIISDKTVEWADIYIDGNKEARITAPPYQKTYKLTNGYHKIKIVARDSGNREIDRTVEFSVKEDFKRPEYNISPTPTLTPTLTASPSGILL